MRTIPHKNTSNDIKQTIEKYGSPDEIKYDYSIAPQWIKQRLAL